MTTKWLKPCLFACQIAAIRYNRQVFPLWTFLQSTSSEEVIKFIDGITYDGSGTRTGLALAYVASLLRSTGNGNRENVDNLVIVITDGMAQDTPIATAPVSFCFENLLMQSNKKLKHFFIFYHAVVCSLAAYIPVDKNHC